ncbi:uncharacterized protein LOC112173239 isoform X1 [Rosa chinensis]|nr:uncharacterized protein LOC112173239 isoform X1 [Rosa chinensis]XP_040363797.1 uncharacterized protein LOC112173239 isoform X1 [Rosa chinensis]XP_040363798.1 uncharacterized protein LOC112173239 isoform X1 [Rosa chinensis]XP_040363799.1 uncharacterized protein LOC112173239 isoform X1 [Rosa chinensis]
MHRFRYGEPDLAASLLYALLLRKPRPDHPTMKPKMKTFTTVLCLPRRLLYHSLTPLPVTTNPYLKPYTQTPLCHLILAALKRSLAFDTVGLLCVHLFACYLSTSTGPVAGTLYLSTARIGFCSDRPLTFTAPSGQSTWSYYKVMIPMMNVGTMNPVVITEIPTLEKYLQIVTTDGHDFWFMGFVNFEKASHHVLDSVSNFRAVGTNEVQPVLA